MLTSPQKFLENEAKRLKALLIEGEHEKLEMLIATAESSLKHGNTTFKIVGEVSTSIELALAATYAALGWHVETEMFQGNLTVMLELS